MSSALTGFSSTTRTGAMNSFRACCPYLASLGVPGVVDVLAAVSVVGWIVDRDDPVTAYAAMDTFVNRYITADEHVAGLVTSHLEDSEPALRRARQAANRAVAGAASVPADSESRAFALADVYKRVVEGPFRQFSWGLYCLQRGEWELPPMLTSLRDRLVSGGGLLTVVTDAVLPDLRNSETHETLAWDGFREEFVTEGGRLQPSRVALALVLATSFAQGCEAGLSAVRSLGLQAEMPFVVRRGRPHAVVASRPSLLWNQSTQAGRCEAQYPSRSPSAGAPCIHGHQPLFSSAHSCAETPAQR